MYVIPCYLSSPHHILLPPACTGFIVCKEWNVEKRE